MHLFLLLHTEDIFLAAIIQFAYLKSKLQSRKNYHTNCCVCNMVSAEYSVYLSDVNIRSILGKQQGRVKRKTVAKEIKPT